jgi:DNA-3-methyladenine glycosylase II
MELAQFHSGNTGHSTLSAGIFLKRRTGGQPPGASFTAPVVDCIQELMNRQHEVTTGVTHLRKDRVLRKVIDAVGPFTVRPTRNRFSILVRAIISQQISGAAARNIRARLDGLLEPEGVKPDSIARLSQADLRCVGLSRQKATYLHDLADKALSGVVRLDKIGRLADEEVIEMLTQVKGIGRWTAEMFLIFSLGRLDVLPVDDLGVRSAIKSLYGLKELPDKATCVDIAAPWRPYASIASWYCWQSLEL